MKQEQLRTWMKPIPWVVPILGGLLIVLSPILMPLMVLINNKDDVVGYYQECFEAMKGVEKEIDTS